MKKIFFINIFFIVLAYQFVSAHTREMMMQILNSTGEPIYKSVQLYIDRGLFYELYRTGYSTDYWKWTQPNANVACDVSDSNTVQPTWASIEPGTYILRCENKYAILTVNYLSEDTLILLRNSGGDGDFNIRYENEVFSLVFNNRGVTLGPTQIWVNKTLVNFKQFKSDGFSAVGTVAIGSGSNFSNRYTAPFDFYVSQNQNYLFHADTNIIISEKYNNYLNINDIVNFRSQYIGTVDYSTSANFKSTVPSVVIKNNFLDIPTLNPITDVIRFKDPWLIDFNEAPYGLRNQGMDAPFKQRQSPFYPDYTTSYNGDVYKGVFLNQEIAPNKPYYSVKADAVQDVQLNNTGYPYGRNHKFYFQNWGGTNVNYQNANALETPVVFTLNGATAQAKLNF